MAIVRTFLFHTLSNCENVYITFPSHVEERLMGTCFRGRALARAGNFSQWSSFYEMRSNEFFRNQLESDVIESINEYLTEPFEGRMDESFELEFDFEVGWSSTEGSESFSADELEPYALNQVVTCMRVRAESNKLAPRTNIVTVVYTLFHDAENMNWNAVIYSIYPGEDVGPLRPEDDVSDLTEREGVVFYPWECPGQVA